MEELPDQVVRRSRTGWNVRGTLALAVTASVPATRAAHAVEPPAACEDPRVRIDGAPDGPWLQSIAQACAALDAKPDSDPSGRVVLVPSGDDLIVEVTLADGRSALRRVRSPDSLGSVLAALLELPTTGENQPAHPSSESAPPAVQSPAPAPAPLPPPPSPRLGIELGGGVSGRVAGGGYLSLGPSAFGQVAVGAWALGIDVRWDAYVSKSGVDANFEMESVAVGVTLTRRFRFQAADIEVGFSPRVVDETQSDDSLASEVTFATTDVRVGALLRAALGHAHRVRPILEIDGELSPSRIRRLPRLDPSLPALPAWSAGATIGILWGDP
jgi:hypothetical protein